MKRVTSIWMKSPLFSILPYFMKEGCEMCKGCPFYGDFLAWQHSEELVLNPRCKRCLQEIIAMEI